MVFWSHDINWNQNFHSGGKFMQLCKVCFFLIMMSSFLLGGSFQYEKFRSLFLQVPPTNPAHPCQVFQFFIHGYLPVSSPIGGNPAGPRSQDVGMDPMTPLAQPRRGTRPPVRLEEIALECLQLHFCLEGWMGALQVYMQISNLMETINGQKVGKGLNVVEPVEILSGSQQPKEDKHHAQHMRKLTNVGAEGWAHPQPLDSGMVRVCHFRSCIFGDCQGSLNQPCGGMKQYNFMVKLRDSPYNGALFELVM